MENKYFAVVKFERDDCDTIIYIFDLNGKQHHRIDISDIDYFGLEEAVCYFRNGDVEISKEEQSNILSIAKQSGDYYFRTNFYDDKIGFAKIIIDGLFGNLDVVCVVCP